MLTLSELLVSIWNIFVVTFDLVSLMVMELIINKILMFC